MVKQDSHPAGMDTFRRGPRPGIPTQFQASYRLWLVAVAAGGFETALAVVDATSGDVGSAAQVAVGVAVRLLALTGLVDLAVQLRQGMKWARVALAVLYGGIGALSLVIGPVTWLAEGGSLTEAVAEPDDRCRRPPSHQAEERALPAGRRHGGHPRRAQHLHPRTCRSRCAPPTSWPGPRVPTGTAACL